jgi:DNA-binding response OmpR family regulator
MRILHVEDDPDIREIALLSLETLGGFTVLQCGSGQEALDQAEAFAPDLFLMDVMMPGLSGPDTLVELRKVAALADVPAIFMTSINTAQANAVDIKALSIGTIQKPFDPVTLADQIREVVAKNG